LPADLLEAIRTGHPPIFQSAEDQVIYAFASELYKESRVSDITYDAAVKHFGETVVINLVGLLGYYALVAMTLNVFNMRAQGQDTLPFSD